MNFPPRCFRRFCSAVPLLIASVAIAADPPLGLLAVPVPKDNPMTAEKISLGKQLYFDGRLSADNKVSCAELPRSSQRFLKRRTIRDRRRREKGRPLGPDGHQHGVSDTAILGRPREDIGRSGARPDSKSNRDEHDA